MGINRQYTAKINFFLGGQGETRGFSHMKWPHPCQQK
jgi:hypothetical protein